MKNQSLLLKSLTGGIFVTFTEFIFGIIFNIILKKNVWDYSNLPFRVRVINPNLFGQICLLYSFFWTALGTVFIPLAGLVSKKINQKFT